MEPQTDGSNIDRKGQFPEEFDILIDNTSDATQIEEDDDVKKIGEILENKGLIRDGELFVLQELISDYHNDLLPGTYELNTSMTAEQMMEVMSSVPEPAEEEEGNKSLDEVAEEVSDDVSSEVIVGSESN